MNAILHKGIVPIVKEHGEWTAMSIHLGNDQYTLLPPVADWRLRRFVQTAADLLGKPLNKARVLDLACLEGHYAIEFALHGADVTAVEIREANIEKARFAKKQLKLDNLTLSQDDVRNVTVEKYGQFDLIICAGFLYHLDVPDVFHTVQRIYDMCTHMAIFETQVSLHDRDVVEFESQKYWGLWYKEHEPDASDSEKYADYWASIDNLRSFWFTAQSLCNLMSNAGFTSLYECHNPVMPYVGIDRRTYVAMKGKREQVLSSPQTDALQDIPTPEHNKQPTNPIQVKHGSVFYFLKRVLPQDIKDTIKPILRFLRLLPPDRSPKWAKKDQSEN